MALALFAKNGKEKMLVNYFQDETERVLADWDGTISLRSVPGKLDWKAITEPLPCGDGWILPSFEYDGSSSGIFGFLVPKWRHPIASGRHDYRNYLLRQMIAEGMSWKEAQVLRKISDQLYRKDILIGQENKYRAKIESFAGYYGTRAGAFLRIGMRPRKT